VSLQPRRRAVTGRALVLGALVVVLLVLLASPLHRYFNSRSDVGHAAQLTQLQAQQRLWSDPGYIQKQARLRLMYAMPGDTVYVVVNPGQKSDIEKTVATPKTNNSATWNEKLWRTVQAAGR
jgi:cell division protein FtsB